MALIDIQNVSKIYQMGDDPKNIFTALDKVSLSIDKGEYVAIIGPSGSGKSTLLQIIGLLDPPTSGSYKMAGYETTELSDNQVTHLRAQKIGFVFQMFNLLSRVSAKDNTLLPMIYQKGRVDHVRVEKVLAQLGMQDHMHHTPSQLSGGQQQRVAIARALVNQPEIILADEPTGNLPQKQAVEIIEELERLHREEDITLLIITHSPELAARADRVVEIVDGKIVKDQIQHTYRNRKQAESPTEVKFKDRFNIRLWMQTTKMALQTMLRNRIRTFLTMLGIIIGVFSVISMLAIGEGAKKNVEHELRRLGSNLFRVNSQWPKIKGSARQKRTITRLNAKDLHALGQLVQSNPYLKDFAATYEGKGTATFEGYSYSTKIIGVSPSYERLRGNYPSHGRFFNEQENENQERVCVIGQTVYKQLFKNQENPIGRSIKIENRNFRVVGLLPSNGTSWGGDVDDVVYVPVETAVHRIFGEDFYTFFYIQAKDELAIKAAIKEVETLLRSRHGMSKGMSDDFAIKNYGEMKDTVDQVSGTMLKLILIVALISLVVGGIGIMNIMLVSVTERTREIGVRKAIGAKSRDILNQFLVESVLIGLVGGLVGVIIAFIVGFVLRSAMGWEIVFKPYGVIVAFLFSLFVGVFFGLYPAQKAAKLSPIKALRYE
ncbi:MAG: ABC transporter permease [Bdellovibrionota bacterium]